MFVTSVLLLAACAGGPPAEVNQQGLIRATKDINPDRRGQASPVTVVLFFLKDTQAFHRADFFSLYQNGEQALGASLLDQSKLQVAPGEETAFESVFPAGVRSIGVIAAFRDIEHAQWRASVDLPEPSFFSTGSSRAPILIEVDKLQVALEIRP